MKLLILGSLVLATSFLVAAPYSTDTSSMMNKEDSQGKADMSQDAGSRPMNDPPTSMMAQPKSDRFTTNDDQKIGNQIRAQLNSTLWEAQGKEIILSLIWEM